MAASTLPAFSKTLIWDLGGTLFKYDKSYLSTKIDKWHYSCYTFFEGKSYEDLAAKTFDILGFIDGWQHNEDEEIMCRDNGSPFPQAFVNWQSGRVKANQLYDMAMDYLEQLKADDEESDSKHDYLYFHSKAEYLLTKDSLDILLSPQTLAHSMKPIKKAVRILKECAAQRNEEGQPLHELFVLSNWDKESFALLQESDRAQEVFNYFDPHHIVISGKIGKVKPHRDMFDYVINKFDLDPAECIFIDDQIENVKAARRAGMTAIHLQDFRQLERELKELAVI